MGSRPRHADNLHMKSLTALFAVFTMKFKAVREQF